MSRNINRTQNEIIIKSKCLHVDYLRNKGITIKDACGYCGISKTCYYKYNKILEDGKYNNIHITEVKSKPKKKKQKGGDIVRKNDNNTSKDDSGENLEKYAVNIMNEFSEMINDDKEKRKKINEKI